MSSRLEHQNNPRYSVGPHEGTFGLSFTPRVRFSRATENDTFSGTAWTSVRRYASATDLNAVDAQLQFDAALKRERRLMNFNLDLLRDSTLATELQRTGFVVSRKQRNSLGAGGSVGYELTERSDLSLGLRYANVSYQDALATGLFDYRYSSLFGDYKYKLSARNELSFSLSVNNFDPDRDLNSSTHTRAEGRYVSFLDERTKLMAQLGLVRFSSSAATRPVFAAAFERSDELNTFAIFASREVNPSGIAVMLETDRVGGDFSRRMSDTWEFKAGLAVYRTSAAGPGAERFADSEFGSAYARMNWRLSREWSLESGLAFGRRHSSGRSSSTVGSSASNTTVHLGLQYAWPKQVMGQ